MQKSHRRLHLASLAFLLAAIAAVIFVMRPSLNQGALLEGFGVSLARVIIAYFISLVLALILGLIAVSSTVIEAVLLPILDVAQSFPSFALLPLLVFYFGHTSLAVIIILVIAMIWPILFAVVGGVKEQRQDQYEAAKIFGARGWRLLTYFRLPMLRPAIMSGSIVSWGEAWDVIVGAEIIAGVAGAGRYLGDISQAGRGALLALGILTYLLLIFIINQAVWLPLLHRYTKYTSET